MPKHAPIDYALLGQQLLTELRQRGLSSGGDLRTRFKISQPTLSRLIRKNTNQILTIGSARHTKYAAIRPLDTLPPRIPIFEVPQTCDPPRLLLMLHSISPRGFWCESASPDIESRFYDDLPYFLFDLQPAGFLGRLVPKIHPDDYFPSDIGLWSQTQTLRYLSLYGWDLPGNLIVGEPALQLFLAMQNNRNLGGVPASEREVIYPRMAREILNYGIPGSSAGGEQPKFLAIRQDESSTVPVLVKFSPPAQDATSVRLADLLICEHIAHRILEESGQPSARSTLIFADDRTFLEVERFDRIQTPYQRRGVISMRALDAEFVGYGEGWREIAQALADLQMIKQEDADRVVWLESFGEVIANTDMHCGNLAFWTHGLSVEGLTPTYDMTCMRYAPYRGHLTDSPLALKNTGKHRPSDALASGLLFWNAVREHPKISANMRLIAEINAQHVQHMV